MFADGTGLLPGFALLSGHGFFLTLALCWLITPGLPYLIAPILESRMLPMSSERQFLGFFPGDLALGTSITLLLTLARRVRPNDAWYSNGWWHLGLLSATVVVAVLITLGELRSGDYPKSAIFSPTKLYHNLALYGGYGYVAVSTLVAVVFGVDWSWGPALLLLAAALFAASWIVLIVEDGQRMGADDALKQSITSGAHSQYWRPFWSKPDKASA